MNKWQSIFMKTAANLSCCTVWTRYAMKILCSKSFSYHSKIKKMRNFKKSILHLSQILHIYFSTLLPFFKIRFSMIFSYWLFRSTIRIFHKKSDLFMVKQLYLNNYFTFNHFNSKPNNYSFFVLCESRICLFINKHFYFFS